MPELLKRPWFEQFVLRSSIVSDAPGVDSPERSKAMGLGAGVEYVHHRTLRGYRRVRDQKSVAAPRNRLGAHDRGGLESRESQHIFKRLLELARFHVVGVRAEAGVTPLRVVRIAAPPPPPTKRWQVSVSQACIDQRSLEAGLREVRVSRRCGEGANIDQMCRAFPCKQSEKLLERTGRVPDRKKPNGVHAPRSCPLPPLDFQREE